MEISNKFKKTALRTAFSYLERDPEENLPKLMAWVDRFAGTGPDSFEPQRDVVRAIVNDPTNNMYKLIMRIMKETDPAVLKVLFENFFLNANIIGWPKQEEYRKKYGCNIPWAILLDPTSACNLHCTGCWAAEYGNRLNLSFDEIDSIITQGKELGVYLYIYTGGEPLVRKKDLIALCESTATASSSRSRTPRSSMKTSQTKCCVSATLFRPSASKALKKPPTAAAAAARISMLSAPCSS